MENHKKSMLTKLIPILIAVAMLIGGVAVGATVLAPSVAQAQEGQVGGSTAPDFSHRFGPGGRFGPGIDYDSFLAEALGITVEELQAAYEVADQAALAEAVAQGYIEEEQVERMQVCKAVNAYIDHDAVVANLLGISVDELQALLEDGKHFPELLEEAGLNNQDVRDAMQAAFEEAVNQAVADGSITQAQADDILSGEIDCARRVGPGGPGMPFGGRGPGRFGPFPEN